MFKLLVACFSIAIIYSTLRAHEKNDTNQALAILYQTKTGSLIRKLIASNKWFSVLAGKYCDSTLSKKHISSFVKKHAISMEESEKMIHEFNNFNDFFIRKLKAGSRPINADPQHIISPADGKILVIENLDQTSEFPVKNISFSLASFLQNEDLAHDYLGGTVVVIRLDPWDYHRFHAPIDGHISKALFINGTYESVNPIVYRNKIQVLSENERHLMILNSLEYGKILMVTVGALCVGRIIETYIPNNFYCKGDELGYFAFGGSTIVLLFKKDTIALNQDILDNSLNYQETSIKMGISIGVIKKTL